jgi:hypothetical protein
VCCDKKEGVAALKRLRTPVLGKKINRSTHNFHEIIPRIKLVLFLAMRSDLKV